MISSTFCPTRSTCTCNIMLYFHLKFESLTNWIYLLHSTQYINNNYFFSFVCYCRYQVSNESLARHFTSRWQRMGPVSNSRRRIKEMKKKNFCRFILPIESRFYSTPLHSGTYFATVANANSNAFFFLFLLLLSHSSQHRIHFVKNEHIDSIHKVFSFPFPFVETKRRKKK